MYRTCNQSDFEFHDHYESQFVTALRLSLLFSFYRYCDLSDFQFYDHLKVNSDHCDNFEISMNHPESHWELQKLGEWVMKILLG